MYINRSLIYLMLLVNNAFALKTFDAVFGDVYIRNIPKETTCHILKERQVDSIWRDVREKEVEFDKAKMWCTFHRVDPRYLVSTVSSPRTLDYFILYRQSGQIFTVEDIVRSNPESKISVENVFDMLRHECTTMGYLQLPRSGRYTMEVTVEHMYTCTKI